MYKTFVWYYHDETLNNTADLNTQLSEGWSVSKTLGDGTIPDSPSNHSRSLLYLELFKPDTMHEPANLNPELPSDYNRV